MSSVRLRATGMILAIVALSAFSRAPRAQPVDEPVDYFAHLLPAKVAWKIDEKTKKFVSLPTKGLRCPRNGIITADGGR